MKKINGKFVEMAINNPELLIENHLNNNAFDDSEHWNIIGTSIYEQFPYLSLLLLFEEDDRINRDLFIENNREKIYSECCNFEFILQLMSPKYREYQIEKKQKLQELQERIEILADEKEKDRRTYETFLKDKEVQYKSMISEIQEKYEKLSLEHNILLKSYNTLKSNKVYIETISDSSLKSLVLHFFKKKPVFDISRLTDVTYNFDGLLNSLLEIAGVSMDKNELVGKKIGSAVFLIKEKIDLLIENNRNQTELSILFEEPELQSLDIGTTRSILQDCCGKPNYVKWDTLLNAKLDINKLINVFWIQFGIELHEKELKAQNRMDNLENYLLRFSMFEDFMDIAESVKKAASKIFKDCEKIKLKKNKVDK